MKFYFILICLKLIWNRNKGISKTINVNKLYGIMHFYWSYRNLMKIMYQTAYFSFLSSWFIAGHWYGADMNVSCVYNEILMVATLLSRPLLTRSVAFQRIMPIPFAMDPLSFSCSTHEQTNKKINKYRNHYLLIAPLWKSYIVNRI